MQWRRTPDESARDPNGVGELLERAHAAIGGPALTGTRFVHDAREMLRQTREIEAAVTGQDTTLYVGFQDARRLEAEADIYRDIVASGADVVAFGTGHPGVDLDVRWVSLRDEPDALENQWYLVARDPRPVAFVGFETSPLSVRARGPAGRPGKTWEGFVSGDARLVDALCAHFEDVAAREDARARGPRG